jgi:hypothetical protein
LSRTLADGKRLSTLDGSFSNDTRTHLRRYYAEVSMSTSNIPATVQPVMDPKTPSAVAWYVASLLGWCVAGVLLVVPWIAQVLWHVCAVAGFVTLAHAVHTQQLDLGWMVSYVPMSFISTVQTMLSVPQKQATKTTTSLQPD